MENLRKSSESGRKSSENPQKRCHQHVYIIKRTLHSGLKIWILFSRGKNNIYSLTALVRKILFCHSKIKFISSRHRVISSIYFFIAAVVIVICLSISSFCHIKFFQIVKRHKIQIQAQQQALQNADNNLNIMRLKKSSVKTFVFYIVMILCYYPMCLNLVLMATNAKDEDDRYWNLYTSIVFLNSSINLILYCWRLSDLRSATVKTARKIFG